MSEKAALITSIPPVAKSPSAKKTSLLTTAQAPVASEGAGKAEVTIHTEGRVDTVSESNVSTATATTTTASSDVAEAAVTITGFQAVIYFSFVLSFCLAGFAAVLLFRKAAKVAEERYVKSAKTLAIAFGLTAFHGVFATYLYNNYLHDTSVGAPLVFSMALWVLVGPAIGIVLNHLLTLKEKPQTKDIAFDVVAYGVIFCGAMLAVSAPIKSNAALLLSLFAGFLFIVPIARFFTLLKKAKKRRPELRETSGQVLVYVLLLLPGLFLLFGVLYALGVLGGDLSLFLINFITFDFVLVVSLAMLACANTVVPVASPEPVMDEEAAPGLDEVAPGLEEVALAQPEPTPVTPAAAPRARAPSIDPIIEFLNSQDAEMEAARPPAEPAPQKVAPPPPSPPSPPSKHLSSAGQQLTPPKKPGLKPEPKNAPNAPTRVKAPVKPKKRF